MKGFYLKLKGQNTINIITLIAGICLAVFPGLFVKTVCYILGALAVCYAIYKFIKIYKSSASAFSMITPFIIFFIGLTLIYNHDGVMSILPITIGVYLMVGGISGLMKVHESFGAFSKNMIKYYLPSAISLIIGLILLFFPFGSTLLVLRVVGAALIYSAIQNFFTGDFNRKQKSSNGPIEGQYEDKSDE